MAKSDKITLEGGNFDWNIGRGYERPAGGGAAFGGALPMGWDSPPEFHDKLAAEFTPTQRVFSDADNAPQVPIFEVPPPVVRPDIDERMAGEVALITSLIEGGAWLDLGSGNAIYQTHRILLSEFELKAVRALMVTAIVRQMEAERMRLIGMLQLEGLQEPAGAGQENVPPVPGPSQPVEPETPS